MRPPKRVDAEARSLAQPALRTCLPGGDLVVPWNDRAWDKTVPTLAGLLAMATRSGGGPAHGPSWLHGWRGWARAQWLATATLACDL